MNAASSSRPQRVCILGATGSVGMATLDVISRHPERFEVVGLTAQHRLEELFALCLRFKPKQVVVATADGAATLGRRLAEAGVKFDERLLHEEPDALVHTAEELHAVL